MPTYLPWGPGPDLSCAGPGSGPQAGLGVTCVGMPLTDQNPLAEQALGSGLRDQLKATHILGLPLPPGFCFPEASVISLWGPKPQPACP